jgi:hypothetical protein
MVVYIGSPAELQWPLSLTSIDEVHQQLTYNKACLHVMVMSLASELCLQDARHLTRTLHLLLQLVMASELEGNMSGFRQPMFGGK